MALLRMLNFQKVQKVFQLPVYSLIRKYTAENVATKTTKGLVLGLYQREEGRKERLTSAGEKFNSRIGGKLMELIKEANMNGALGKGKVFNNLDPEFSAIAVVGLGYEGVGYNELEAIDEGMENVRRAAGFGAKTLQRIGCNQVYVDAMDFAEQAAEGSSLAVWQYQDNKTKITTQIPKLELYESPEVDAWTRGLFKAEAQNLARKLTDAPACQMTPSAFAQAAIDALCPCGIHVEVRNMDWIETQNLNSFLSVARSSCEPPVFLEMTYCGAEPDEKPIMLVGKGLTFNSGGLNLRKKYGMDEYRASMAGAAVVVATIRAAAALSLPLNICALVPLCENMPSGMAMKPGDVVKCLNRKTIAIHDTSKVGVVMMADTMTYGENTYKPRIVVDVATISDGVQKAFGSAATGVFTNSHFLWKQFHTAGSTTGDRVWRLPLWQYYKSQVTDILSADVSNQGDGTASACLAAAVLKEFVTCPEWAHLDTRGVGMLATDSTIPYISAGRMTGRPTRTLVQFLYQLACPDEAAKETAPN